MTWVKIQAGQGTNLAYARLAVATRSSPWLVTKVADRLMRYGDENERAEAGLTPHSSVWRGHWSGTRASGHQRRYREMKQRGFTQWLERAYCL